MLLLHMFNKKKWTRMKERERYNNKNLTLDEKNNLNIYSYKSMELIHSFTQLFEFFCDVHI